MQKLKATLIICGAAALALAATGCPKKKGGTKTGSGTAATKAGSGTGSAKKAGSAASQPAGGSGKAGAASQPASGSGKAKGSGSGTGATKLVPCDRVKFAKLALTAGTKVLAGVKLEKSVKQADLLASPQLYKGKTVRIEGPIVGVCRGMGCWAAVQGPGGKHLNLKVKDGVVDFRPIAKVGFYAVGEGVFTPTGHHGAQIKIAGAMISKKACSL